MTRSYRPQDLHRTSTGTLELAAQGFFWVGAQRFETPVGTVLRGQMYVEYWIPKELLHPLPIVMIHGGGGQGLDFLGTPDGREGVGALVREAGLCDLCRRPPGPRPRALPPGRAGADVRRVPAHLSGAALLPAGAASGYVPAGEAARQMAGSGPFRLARVRSFLRWHRPVADRHRTGPPRRPSMPAPICSTGSARRS